jgi:Na+-driven multidrug efflux pump
MAFGQIVNQMASGYQGIMRGLAQLNPATAMALIAYYGFAIPLGYLYAFRVGNEGRGLSVYGLWLGMYNG